MRVVSFVAEVIGGHELVTMRSPPRSEPRGDRRPMNDYSLGAIGALTHDLGLRCDVPSATHERAQLVTIDGRCGVRVVLRL